MFPPDGDSIYTWIDCRMYNRTGSQLKYFCLEPTLCFCHSAIIFNHIKFKLKHTVVMKDAAHVIGSLQCTFIKITAQVLSCSTIQQWSYKHQESAKQKIGSLRRGKSLVSCAFAYLSNSNGPFGPTFRTPWNKLWRWHNGHVFFMC